MNTSEVLYLEGIIKMYEEGKISLSKCAELMGVSIEECMNELRKRGIGIRIGSV